MSGAICGFSGVQLDLVHRGLDMLRAERRRAIADINYSMEKLRPGDSEIREKYVNGRARVRTDIKEIDALLEMLGFEPEET